MNKSKNGLFTIALILVGVHLLFTMIAGIFYSINSFRVNPINGVSNILTYFIAPLATDVLIIIGLALKKKPLIITGFFVAAGFALLDGLFSLINALVNRYTGIWTVGSLFYSLAIAVVYVALALLVIGLFRLIEEPDNTHPFAQKKAPQPAYRPAYPQQPYPQQPAAPQAPAQPYMQQPPQAPAPTAPPQYPPYQQ